MLFFLRKRKQPHLPDQASASNAPQAEQVDPDSGSFHEEQGMLRHIQDRLSQLAGSTENEFLTIGARLQDFHARSAQIGGASTTVTDQVGGIEIREAIGELGEIIDRMGAFLSLVERETAQSSLTLKNILQMIAGVDEPLAGFKKIMKVLHVLGTSTKIESARLGPLGEGFNSLADDVENLAVQINDKSVRIMGENVALSGKIRETLTRMSDLETARREDVYLVLDRTRSSLKMISDLHRKCAEVAAAVAASSGEVSRNISEVVTALQIHDITRQQLEHVQEALIDLDSRLEPGQSASAGMGIPYPSTVELAGEVFGVCRLQSAQLVHARDGLTVAVTGIVLNLQGLADKGRAMARWTREMIDVADGAGGSFFIELERNLSPVVALLAESVAANRNLTQAVDSVAATVGEISLFVNDIETIGEEIKLIALNSQVKAARTGAEGAALGVLAEAIQRLSVDACVQTTAVTDTLRDITRATEALSGGEAADASTGELDVEALADRLKGLIESIRGMNDGVMVTLAQTDDAAQELSSDIENTTYGITVQGTVTTAVEGITEALEQIMTQARVIAPEAATIDLAALGGRYTMQSERLIHASILQGNEAGGQLYAAGTEPGETGGDDDGLGDNVELF